MCRRVSWNTVLCSSIGLLVVSAAAQTNASRPLITQAVDDSQRVTLQGSTHPLAVAKYDRGVAPPDLAEKRMLLACRRSPEQERDLQNMLQAQMDPASSQYQKWLTPDEFGLRFGVNQQDADTVSAWLRTRGFAVERLPAGRNYIEFSGTAAQVEQAFRTSIHRYNVNGEAHVANSSDPQIPEALAAAVTGIVSLHNFQSRPNYHVVRKQTKGPKPQFTGTPGSEYVLAPYDFFTIYHETPLLSASTNGAGQTIAIVSRSNLDPSDIETFRSSFLPSAYPALPLIITVDGPDPGDVSGDDVEAALDVEWSGAIAPAATVNMVVAASTDSTDGVDLSAAYIVNHNLAPVMSASFGSCEAFMSGTERQFYLNLWQQASTQGMTVLVSAGDSGAAGCESPASSGDYSNPTVATTGLNINGLASTPYNTAVGGSEFNDSSNYGKYWSNTNGPENNSALGYIPEFVWNESCSPTRCGNAEAALWSGGGGASILYAKPSWQSGIPGIPADGVRDIPDVSLTAAGHDGYFVYLQGSFIVVNGTSAASPSFAGVVALVDQKTGIRQGGAAKILYSLAKARVGSLTSCNSATQALSGSSCVFYDVTQGSNAVPCAGGSPNCSSSISGSYGVTTGYSAGTGYDLASGLGSINVANLVNAWAQVTGRPTVNGITPSSGSGSTQSFQLSFSDLQGWQNISVVDVLINGALDGRHACYVAYLPNQNILYLVSDDGGSLLPGITLNGSSSVSNSQCTINGSGTAGVGSGNNLTLTLNVTFKSAFAGRKILYAAVGDQEQNNSGWTPAAVWQVPGVATTALQVQGMSPSQGQGHSHAFTFTFTDTNGIADIGVVDMLMNGALDGRHACYVAYVRSANIVYLVSDDGTKLLGPLTLNGSGSVSNSQCTIAGAGSSASASGNTLSVTLNYTFNSSFAGDRIFYLAEGNASSTVNTGWQASGAWTVQ